MGWHSGHTRVAWLRRGLSLGLCLLGWGIGLATAATGAPLPDLVGDDPQVCARSAGMRGALLDALTPVGGEMPVCEEVTVAQLAGIRELGAAPSEADMAIWDLVGRLTRPRQFGMYITHRFTPDGGYDTLGLSAPVRVQSARDLAGLTGLESLALRFEGQGLPSDFLASVPRLTHLELDTGYLTRLPSDFLAPVPQLTHLTLKLSRADLIELPSDFLAPVPRLTHLTLKLSRTDLIGLPPDFLAPVPRLTRLELLGVNATLLPSNFLAPVPRLTHLELHHGGPTAILETDTVPSAELPSDFLAPVPRLTRLELRGVTVVLLPPAFLAHVPALTHLELGRTVVRPLPSDFLAHVPNLAVLSFRYLGEEPDFLAPVPRLTHLYFAVPSQTWPPPADFLVPVSRLTHLNIRLAHGMVLPPDFLVPVSQLTHLNIRLAHGMVLPPDFLAPVPALVHLRLYQSSGGLGSVEQNRLPSGFLDHTPQLARLEIRGVEPTALPPGFLAPMPRLTHLILVADDHLGTVHPEPENFPDTLSPGFLAPVPSLTHLELESQTLRVLAPNFLDHTPRLTRLYLSSDRSTHYPADVLVPVPHLTHLTLRCIPTPLPVDFLVPVPHLTFLNLCIRGPLPAEFLVPVPQLTHLRLDTWGGLLPAEFLAPVPQLTHLVGDTPKSDFAADVPRLAFLDTSWGDAPLSSLPSVTHLRLGLYGTLSDGFLAHVPQLTHLRLHSVDLQAFPPGFLAHAPRLQRFEAVVWSLEELPSGFLAHVPRLTHFTVSVPNETPVDTFKTLPADFLAHAPSLKSLRLPYKLMRERRVRLPDPVWNQVRDHGIESLVIVTARHTAQLSFPSDPNGVRYDILNTGLECGYDQQWQIRTGADTVALVSPDETREARLHIQEAPRAGLRELQGQTDREAILQIVAGTAPRFGMLQGQPLYSRPSRQGRVIGYVPWGTELRVTARHGEGTNAWLHGVPTASDSLCADGGWLPATAIWTVDDRGLDVIVGWLNARG